MILGIFKLQIGSTPASFYPIDLHYVFFIRENVRLFCQNVHPLFTIIDNKCEIPKINKGAPGATRTRNLLIRSQVLIVSTACYSVHCVHRLHKIGVILSTLSIVSTSYHGRCTRVAPEKRKGDSNLLQNLFYPYIINISSYPN